MLYDVAELSVSMLDCKIIVANLKLSPEVMAIERIIQKPEGGGHCGAL